MGYAILRMEPRSIEGAHAMLRHALREAKVPNAIEDAPPPMVLEGSKTAAEGMKRLLAMVDACKAAKRWQRSIKPVLDVLVTFSRDDSKRLTERQREMYFSSALNFLADRFGGMDNVLTAVVHEDETTSHMQVLIAARHAADRLSSSKYMGNRANLSKLQDDFWDTCGKPLGLMRGQKRAQAKHVPVRALYAAMNAGAEPPQFIDVLPELGMVERLRMGRDEREEYEQKRAAAIEHNRQARALLLKQAEDGRKLHPSLLAKQADRYRAAVQQADEAQNRAKRSALQLEGIDQAIRQRKAELEETEKALSKKQRELRSIDADIDNLRAMRDREQGYDPGFSR